MKIAYILTVLLSFQVFSSSPEQDDFWSAYPDSEKLQKIKKEILLQYEFLQAEVFDAEKFLKLIETKDLAYEYREDYYYSFHNLKPRNDKLDRLKESWFKKGFNSILEGEKKAAFFTYLEKLPPTETKKLAQIFKVIDNDEVRDLIIGKFPPESIQSFIDEVLRTPPAIFNQLSGNLRVAKVLDRVPYPMAVRFHEKRMMSARVLSVFNAALANIHTDHDRIPVIASALTDYKKVSEFANSALIYEGYTLGLSESVLKGFEREVPREKVLDSYEKILSLFQGKNYYKEKALKIAKTIENTTKYQEEVQAMIKKLKINKKNKSILSCLGDIFNGF